MRFPSVLVMHDQGATILNVVFFILLMADAGLVIEKLGPETEALSLRCNSPELMDLRSG
jgi:hypothetical protein